MKKYSLIVNVKTSWAEEALACYLITRDFELCNHLHSELGYENYDEIWNTFEYLDVANKENCFNNLFKKSTDNRIAAEHSGYVGIKDEGPDYTSLEFLLDRKPLENDLYHLKERIMEFVTMWSQKYKDEAMELVSIQIMTTEEYLEDI